MNIPKSDLPRIVVVGGGFGGVTLSRKLSKLNVQLILLDRHNYHTFQPLLYQVATSGLEPDSIAFPLRSIVEDNEDYFFRMANVTHIHGDRQTIETNIGELDYDYLILATGSKTNFFGNKELEKKAMSMKSVPESLDIRSLMLQNLELATLTEDEERKKVLMRIVLSGAGPTGVELAGAFSEFKKGVLPTDYPDMNPDNMEIILLDGADQVLSGMSKKSAERAQKYLEDLGVKIILNTMVKDYEGDVVKTNTDLEIETATFIWSAGVTGEPINGIPKDSLQDPTGRYIVDRFNEIDGLKNVYAVGDAAYMETEDFPNGHPMVAQPAIQQGKNLADNIKRMLSGKDPKPFSYFDKGTMAVIGRNRAVADIWKTSLGGTMAWLTWLGIHLYFLVGVRNRIVVFLNWVYNYFNFDRAARLIIRPYKK